MGGGIRKHHYFRIETLVFSNDISAIVFVVFPHRTLISFSHFSLKFSQQRYPISRFFNYYVLFYYFYHQFPINTIMPNDVKVQCRKIYEILSKFCIMITKVEWSKYRVILIQNSKLSNSIDILKYKKISFHSGQQILTKFFFRLRNIFFFIRPII